MREAAFFDVDETVINIKSMFSFLEFYIQHGSKEPLIVDMTFEELMAHFKYMGSKHSRSYVNKQYYKLFEGVSIEHFTITSERWFKSILDEGLKFHQPVIEHINQHFQVGREVVFVSGACNEILSPIAKHLGVSYLLGVKLELKEGRITGGILPPQTIGEGKADAVKQFIRNNNLLSENCYAYGDHPSDIPMLDCVGQAYAVGNNQETLSWAKEHNKNNISI